MRVLSVVIMLFFSSICFGQVHTDVDTIIKKEMKTREIPALAVAVIESGKIIHLSADGLRDLENNLEANINTPFHIASVSKIVVNLAIFKMVELGKINLEADVNNYLPFEVKNPHFPNDKITVHELLNHRSGIRDDFEIYGPHWNNPKGDPKIKLSEFLKDYLYIHGKLYNPSHYARDAKFKDFSYSNTGYALLGLIIEHVSDLSFEDFCRIHIFKPVGMKNTSYFLRYFDISLVSKTYVYKNSNYEFRGYNGYPDYPGGQLRTSIYDYSRLIAGYLNSDKDLFILKSATTNTITPNPIIKEGYYTWFLNTINNHLYYMHGGGDVGARATVIMDVINKNAIIIFTNSEANLDNLLKNIEKKLFE